MDDGIDAGQCGDVRGNFRQTRQGKCSLGRIDGDAAGCHRKHGVAIGEGVDRPN